MAKLMKKEKKAEGNASRPVRLEITCNFPVEGARKVTPNDLDMAAAAAAAAWRASLEARTPAYKVLDLCSDVAYSYVLARRSREH